MPASPHISRRKFLAWAAGAAIGVGLGERASGAAPLGRQPQADTMAGHQMRYRRLGRTEVMVSVIAGGGMPEVLFTRAIEAGINYWHALGNWQPPEALAALPRESFWCDMVIDHLDEEKAVEQFESGLAKSGLEMIDFFKVHSLYRRPEDITEHPGILRAFERLKKAGKTRWLAASQHSSISEVLPACIESGLFDAIQPSYNPALAQEVDEVIALAKKHDVGVIAMKTMMGGPDRWAGGESWEQKVEPYLGNSRDMGQALIRFALARDGVTAVVLGVRNFTELEDAVAASRSSLAPEEKVALTALGAAVGAQYCRMCARCDAACPRGIALADIFRFQMYWRDYGDMARAASLYSQLPRGRTALGCDRCGRCETACPHGRQVVSLLQDAHTMLA